jgi:preprotein translocase subunit YajC
MKTSETFEIQLAQAAPAPEGSQGAGGTLGFFLPLIAMFLLLYALVIRPQSRQQKEHKKMLSQVQRGDHIVTSGGLHGRITGIADDVLTVEIADRVRVKVSRSAVSARTPSPESKERKEPKREAKEKSA